MNDGQAFFWAVVMVCATCYFVSKENRCFEAAKAKIELAECKP
jgi:hypothetical protein